VSSQIPVHGARRDRRTESAKAERHGVASRVALPAFGGTRLQIDGVLRPGFFKSSCQVLRFVCETGWSGSWAMRGSRNAISSNRPRGEKIKFQFVRMLQELDRQWPTFFRFGKMAGDTCRIAIFVLLVLGEPDLHVGCNGLRYNRDLRTSIRSWFIVTAAGKSGEGGS